MALAVAYSTGCTSSPKVNSSHLALEGFNSREQAMFNGKTGATLSWDEMFAMADSADAIIIGEQHDDAHGHRIQLAFVEDSVNKWDDVALSLEMMDRSEQAIADDYLYGLIDRNQFIEATASTKWRKITADYLDGSIKKSEFRKKILTIGWPDWEFNYQPIVDAAIEADAKVIAANAPWTRYTSLINLEDGYSKLDTLSESQRALVDYPEEVLQGKYRERFWQFLAQRKEGEEPPPKEESEEDQGPHMGNFSDEQVLRAFMKQSLYDATMGASIANALNNGVGKVVHLVGQFHSDFNGGTVSELQHNAPSANILTISIQKGTADSLREDDENRADIVIYSTALEN